MSTHTHDPAVLPRLNKGQLSLHLDTKHTELVFPTGATLRQWHKDELVKLHHELHNPGESVRPGGAR